MHTAIKFNNKHSRFVIVHRPQRENKAEWSVSHLDPVQLLVAYKQPETSSAGSGTCERHCLFTAMNTVWEKKTLMEKQMFLPMIINDSNQADLPFNFANCSILPGQLLA